MITIEKRSEYLREDDLMLAIVTLHELTEHCRPEDRKALEEDVVKM